MQKLSASACPFPLEVALLNHLNAEIAPYSETSSVTLTYHDAHYSAKEGGFHPVEIRIEAGLIQYITDFAYVGSGDTAELASSGSGIVILVSVVRFCPRAPEFKGLAEMRGFFYLCCLVALLVFLANLNFD